MNIIGKVAEMNWGSIVFKGKVLSNDEDFYYSVEVTESNSNNIPVGSIKIIMEDDITGIN